VSEIAARRALSKDYVRVAVAAETSGLKVRLKTTDEFAAPDEFARRSSRILR